MNNWQVGKDRFGSQDDSGDTSSWPSNAQKGMKAETAEPFLKCGGWLTSSRFSSIRKDVNETNYASFF